MINEHDLNDWIHTGVNTIGFLPKGTVVSIPEDDRLYEITGNEPKYTATYCLQDAHRSCRILFDNFTTVWTYARNHQ